MENENWRGGYNVVIIPYMIVGRIPFHDVTTLISVASKAFKNEHFWKCVIVY